MRKTLCAIINLKGVFVDEQKVVENFVEMLKSDPEMYYGYQSNIAMAFYDEYRRTGNNLSHEKVHEVANNAAKKFLNQLIK